MINQYATDWAQDQHNADGGHAASIASAHERVAPILRNLPDNLIAAGGTQYLYAAQGADGERQAAVDEWAAAHHVKAGQRDNIGYCAEVTYGPYSVMAVAIPERRAAAPAARTAEAEAYVVARREAIYADLAVMRAERVA